MQSVFSCVPVQFSSTVTVTPARDKYQNGSAVSVILNDFLWFLYQHLCWIFNSGQVFFFSFQFENIILWHLKANSDIFCVNLYNLQTSLTSPCLPSSNSRLWSLLVWWYLIVRPPATTIFTINSTPVFTSLVTTPALK